MKQKDIPRELWINDEHWKIKFVRKLKLGKVECRGLCDPSIRTIFILQGQTYIERADSFWHEVTHALSFEYDFDEIPHKYVYKLGAALAYLQFDNFD